MRNKFMSISWFWIESCLSGWWFINVLFQKSRQKLLYSNQDVLKRASSESVAKYEIKHLLDNAKMLRVLLMRTRPPDHHVSNHSLQPGFLSDHATIWDLTNICVSDTRAMKTWYLHDYTGKELLCLIFSLATFYLIIICDSKTCY